MGRGARSLTIERATLRHDHNRGRPDNGAKVRQTAISDLRGLGMMVPALSVALVYPG